MNEENKSLKKLLSFPIKGRKQKKYEFGSCEGCGRRTDKKGSFLRRTSHFYCLACQTSVTADTDGLRRIYEK